FVDDVAAAGGIDPTGPGARNRHPRSHRHGHIRRARHRRAAIDPLCAGAGDKWVLFIHGAGTPAEVSFDVPYQDYSWMGYLAKAGYDVFSVDMTGYGRSGRPAPIVETLHTR